MRVVDHLPLKSVDTLILLSLARRPLHGYGLVKELEERSGGLVSPEPGNLYRYIRRLVNAGLAEKADRRPGKDVAGERRVYYQITTLGRSVLAAEAERLRRLSDAAHGALEGDA